MAGVKGRSGGARPGSGPKRRDPAANWLSGHAKVRPPASRAASGVAVACPDDLDAPAAAMWAELAPHAVAQGTLTAGTAVAFAMVCRNVVLERLLAASKETVARNDHRGMMQRVEAGFARFRLIPDGRPVQVAEPKDEWQEFDAPLKVVGGTG